VEAVGVEPTSKRPTKPDTTSVVHFLILRSGRNRTKSPEPQKV